MISLFTGEGPMSRPFTMVAALIFFGIALLHVYRLFTHFQVVLGSHVLPEWISYVGVLVPGVLAYMLVKERRR